MKYALIKNGLVAEVIEPFVNEEGVEVPIAKRFHPDFVAQLVPYDPANPPAAPAAPEVPVDVRIGALRSAVQAHLDAGAAALGYDDIRTAVTYADEPAVPKFQGEGAALRAWRSRVWAGCYDVLGKWQAGKVQEPTAAELIAMLPALDLVGGKS